MKESIASKGLREKILMGAAIFGLFFGLIASGMSPLSPRTAVCTARSQRPKLLSFTL